MASFIVVSVGTSLITNNSEVIKDHFNAIKRTFDDYRDHDYFKNLKFVFDTIKTNQLKTVEPDSAEIIAGFSKEFFNIYLNEDKIKKCISGRKHRQEDTLPAEIPSLYLYYYNADGVLRPEFEKRLKSGDNKEFQEKDEIILLTTPTPDAVYCAKMLTVLIEKVPFFNTKCELFRELEIVEDLNVLEPSKYIKSGLKKLYDFFNRKRGELIGRDKILIRTGAFKEISADLKMVAMDTAFISYYLFENSTDFVVTNQKVWPNGFIDIISNLKISP